MTTFAVTSTDQTLDAVNYLLSNLNQTGNVGNITIPTGTLIGNTTSGIVSTYNAGGGNAYSYLYQYINLRYANNATGTSGFSTLPGNAQYFGVYNSITSAASSVPAAYTFYQVAGGFGTTKTIFYSTQGGRQIQFVPANVAPSSSFIQSTANVAIDLDVVTTAAGTPGERGAIAMAYVVTPSTPVGASDLQLTAWWEAARDSLTPPIGTGLTPVTGDTGTFIYGAGVGTPSETYEFNGSGWNEVVPQVISGNVIVGNSLPGTAITASTITGNRIVPATLTGNLVADGTLTGNLIVLGTITGNLVAANTLTGNLVAANTITATNIQTNTITSNQIAANTITATNILTGTITSNKIAANTITATNIASGTITAGQIAANTITATQISTSYLYTGNIISNNGQIGNTSSPGYWLQYNNGDARFGGNVSIGANLNVSGLITTSGLNSNTVNTVQVVVNAISDSAGAEIFTQNFIANTAVSGTAYFISGPTTTTTTTNQAVSVWSFGTWRLRMRPSVAGTALAYGSLVGRIVRWPTGSPSLTDTLLTYSVFFTKSMPTVGVDYDVDLNLGEFPPIYDVVSNAGNYTYGWECEYNLTTTAGTYTRTLSLTTARASGIVTPNTILITQLKR